MCISSFPKALKSVPLVLVVTPNEITKRADPMQETQWEDKQDVKNKVVKSSPRERLEELAGGSTEEKEEKQFEHLPKATSGLIDQFDNDMINTLESGLGYEFYLIEFSCKMEPPKWNCATS